jgi:hypothetical protein
MRITGLERAARPLILSVLTCAFVLAQTEATPWLPTIAKLASSLSQNDSVGALETLDAHMKDRGAIEADLEALAAQTDVLCAIDVVEDAVEDKDTGDLHKLDVDWYMELKSRADGGPTERRRERVQIEVRLVKNKWKIVSISPMTILAPIHINN